MSDRVTILTYSSNRESPVFAARIRAQWQAVCGDLPVVSVTQQPMPDLGLNICVGDVGASNYNLFRQVQIGCEAATTDFVLSVEADCLYPPDYFTFVPDCLDRCYRNTNVYVMPQHRAFYWRKPKGDTHAQIVGRLFYLDTLRWAFADGPAWSMAERNFPKERLRRDELQPADAMVPYATDAPVVQLKTSDGMRHYTTSDRIDIPSLPYWGDGRDVRRRYFDRSL